MFAILGSITVGKPYLIYPCSKAQANFKQETAYNNAETEENTTGNTHYKLEVRDERVSKHHSFSWEDFTGKSQSLQIQLGYYLGKSSPIEGERRKGMQKFKFQY